MKTMFTSGIFWGSILILIGISVLLKVIFGINIPIMRILFAFLLIYAGISLIRGISFKQAKEETIVFGKSETNGKSDVKSYNVVFGKSHIDLSSIPMDSVSPVEVNVVFSHGEVVINPDVPMVIRVSAAFAAANFPDQTTISFGERVYKTLGWKEGVNFTEVRMNVVFGNLDIRLNQKSW